jgi:hypothetical protein
VRYKTSKACSDFDFFPCVFVLCSSFDSVEMGGKGSKSSVSKPDTPKARMPVVEPRKPVTVVPTPTPTPTPSKTKMQYKGVVSFRDGPAVAVLEKMLTRGSLQFYNETEVCFPVVLFIF